MTEKDSNRAHYNQEEEADAETKADISAEAKADSCSELFDDRKEHVSVAFPQEEIASSIKISPTAQKSVGDHELENSAGNSSMDRDDALARVELERRLALIKAWEDNEKTKADNKAYKKLSALDAWENTRKALAEAEMKQIQIKLEKKKAEYGEKIKNKMSMIHKEAEEKKALVEADLGKQVLMVEKAAANFRASGRTPKRLFSCFSC